MNRFIVMRHAAYFEKTQEITDVGLIQIKKAVKILDKYFLENNIFEIKIFHSPAKRAANTATEIMNTLSVKVHSLTPEPKFRMGGILSIVLNQKDYLQGDNFALIIGHQSDIEDFLWTMGCRNVIIGNCNCFLQDGEKLED